MESFWSDQARSGRTVSAGPVCLGEMNLTGHFFSGWSCQRIFTFDIVDVRPLMKCQNREAQEVKLGTFLFKERYDQINEAFAFVLINPYRHFYTFFKRNVSNNLLEDSFRGCWHMFIHRLSVFDSIGFSFLR